MRPVQGQVKSLFEQALRTAFPQVPAEVQLAPCQPKFGDYQCNNAMSMFKEHGATLGLNGIAIGQAIVKALPENDLIESADCVGGGFVNVKLNAKWLEKQVQTIVRNEIEFHDTPRKRVVVDFSSPNIAKEMHVGHLRSTIIGESTCRILEFCGHEVHRLNHVGDWGTQFGMLIEYMKEVYPNFEKELPAVSDLQEFYKAAKKRFDDDDAFKEKARLAVVDLQAGGAFATMAWQKICDVSRVAFQKIYDRLGITVYERGESFYNSLIPPLVKELEARGLVKDSDGAKCLFTPKVAEIPLMAVKSDGGYGYDSTDLAAIYHRLFVMRADWIVYITDMGQELHFHMIFDAAEQAGWHRPPATRCDHMGFGVVQGEDHKKFKTRSGETVKLSDLLDEAVERAHVEIKKRVEEQGDNAFIKGEDEQLAAATQLGIAAVRYFDMKQNRTSPYVFSYERMLDPKGNSAVFLFYAYARIRQIQKKAGVDIASIDPTELKIEHAAERELALKICKFADTMQGMLANLHLHQLTDYLWEICNCYTAFNRDCRVIGVPEMNSRLLLCEATRKVLLKSFFLLGFEPLERI
jgi:arginyl-tRNA synthetase